MEIHLERYKGPSKLDERLEEFRNPETGRVTMKPDEARKILFKSLRGYLKEQTGGVPEKIEALFRLAGSEEHYSFDYTEILEGVKEKSAEARERTERARREMDKANIITSQGPSQPEI